MAGPVSGHLSDRFGARLFATTGMAVFAASLAGLMLLPVAFPYWAFAALIALNGVGAGMFSAPNTASIMSSVPASQRGAASGMRSTFQNAGGALSVGAFFPHLIAGPFAPGLSVVFAAGTLLAVLAAAASLLRGQPVRADRPAEREGRPPSVRSARR